MNIKINTKYFVEFLEKINMNGLIKDAIVFASDGMLSSRIADDGGCMYCEVYEKKVQIEQEGSIRIPAIKTAIAIAKRADSELISIISNDRCFAISDGEQTGKMKVEIIQPMDETSIQSFRGLKGKQIFDRKKLAYNAFSPITYANGFAVTKSLFDTILKDAKAFGYEIYKLENKNGFINCILENTTTGEKFRRTLCAADLFDNDGNIPVTVVGSILRSMIDSLSDPKMLLSVYVDETSWLITDNETFYYNLHTAAV